MEVTLLKMIDGKIYFDYVTTNDCRCEVIGF
jgi:hypothetical protein